MDRGSVSAFFDLFVDAFRSFNGARVAELYSVPVVALRGDGVVQLLQSRSEIERFFQAALDRYHRDGCRTCRCKDLDVVPLGSRSVLGSVTWELLSQEGHVVKEWRQSYNLVRVETDWRVFASTYHVP